MASCRYWCVVAVVFLVIVMAACAPRGAQPSPTQTPKVAAAMGDTVLVDYVGKLENGNIFDTSLRSVAESSGLVAAGRVYKPLEVRLGDHTVIPGFENGLVGMKVGEKKTITISSDQGYGERLDDNIQEVPLSLFGDSIDEIRVGQTIGLVDDAGRTRAARVAQIGTSSVVVDLNHPLAGETLIFEVEVKEIK